MGKMDDLIKNAFKKLDKYNNILLTIYLIINVIWIFLGAALVFYKKTVYKDFSTSLLLLFITNLLIIIYANIRKKIKFDKIDIFVILLTIFAIISTIFSKNITTSLYGTFKRYEGLFQILYYYSLFYLCTQAKNKKIIVNFILFFGLLNGFAAYLQVYDTLKFIPLRYRGSRIGSGFTSNANFLSSYMVICAGLSMGQYLYEKNKKNILYLILSICFYIGILLSGTTSGIVSYYAIWILIIVYLIYKIIKKNIAVSDIIKPVILIVLCIITSFMLNNNGNKNNNKIIMNAEVKKMVEEVKNTVDDISENKTINDSYGSNRIFIWKKIIKNVPKYWLHGVGIDCLIFTEEHPFSLSKFQYFDKAHNEYLQKLITEGVLSAITYISFLFIIFIVSLKNILKENKNITYLFLAFIGYSLQAFFNISIIEVAPLYFIVMGLLYERNTKKIEI